MALGVNNDGPLHLGSTIQSRQKESQLNDTCVMSALLLFPQRTNAFHSLTSRPSAAVDYHKDRLGKGSAGSSGGADNNSKLCQL